MSVKLRNILHLGDVHNIIWWASVTIDSNGNASLWVIYIDEQRAMFDAPMKWKVKKSK